MKLYQIWQNMAESQQTQQAYQQYWDTYFAMETENYKKLLSQHETVFSGKEQDLAKEFDMDEATFCGFLDGINTSLKTPIAVEEVEEDTNITLDVDFEMLYYNMLKAKAPWLYNLTEWDGVLSSEKRKEITKKFRDDNIFRSEVKVGRNDPCPCGSGKKYKNCCGKK